MSDRESELREVSGFNRISLAGVGNLIIEPGDRESLRIEAEPDVLPRIITQAKGGKLTIRLKRSGLPLLSRHSKSIDYYVTVRELEAIDVSGSGTVRGSRLCSDRLRLAVSGSAKVDLDLLVADLRTKVSGAARIRLAGRADRQELVVSGSGEYCAGELVSDECVVAISGSAKGTVNVNERLEARISGSGRVSYVGDPAVDQRVSGVGRVNRIAAPAAAQ